MDEVSEGGLAGPAEGPLSRASARTLYNVADALAECDVDRTVDVVPYLIQQIRWGGVPTARRVWLFLTVLEWWPLLAWIAPGRFSWLPAPKRRAALGSLARFPGPWRGAHVSLREWVLEAHADAAVRAGDADQSSGE